MYYGKKFIIINSIIEVVTKLNNNLHKLAIERNNRNSNNKAKSCRKYTNYYNKRQKINR